jgi:hypothetical protein
MRRTVPAAALGIGFPVLVALSAWRTGDYMPHGPVGGDNAAPAIVALSHGHVSAFLANQPLMGLTSILLRLPVLALANAAHAGSLTTYRLGAFACLLPVGLLAGWIIARAGASTRRLVAAILAAIIVLVGPATSGAVLAGHPEEVLASALATGAVLAAMSDRPRVAAVLLGLAIGTKQWALFATVPVLIAAPRERMRIVVVAGSLGLLLSATLPLADPAAFGRAKDGVFGIRWTDPFSVWWPFRTTYIPAPGTGGAHDAIRLPLGLTRSSASAVSLTLALGVIAAFAVARRRRIHRLDPLALLALLGLLRCVADPTPLEYNFVDLLIPLAVWESVTRDRVPVLTAVAMGVLWLATEQLVHSASWIPNSVILAGSVVLGSYLVRCALAVAPAGSGRRFTFGRHEPITTT